MQLGISNIAWDVSEDAPIADMLVRHQVSSIDIAPGKYFQDVETATREQVVAVKNWWRERGIEIAGMQALLFGAQSLNMFAGREVQESMLKRLAAVCRIGGLLGATRLVFGSPKNRDASGVSSDRIDDIASSFFRRLGDSAASEGVVMCLEPNPPCYGANFMTTAGETARIVEMVGHPAIKLHFDTGAVTINGESAASELQAHRHLVRHVHLSEPHLAVLGEGGTDHGAMSQALKEHLPDTLATIEMAAATNEPHLAAVERALRNAVRFYRSEEGGAP